MRETLHDLWTLACVAFTIGVAAERRARHARNRRRIRRRAGAW